jgi:hypothetical protein
VAQPFSSFSLTPRPTPPTRPSFSPRAEAQRAPPLSPLSPRHARASSSLLWASTSALLHTPLSPTDRPVPCPAAHPSAPHPNLARAPLFLPLIARSTCHPPPLKCRAPTCGRLTVTAHPTPHYQGFLPPSARPQRPCRDHSHDLWRLPAINPLRDPRHLSFKRPGLPLAPHTPIPRSPKMSGSHPATSALGAEPCATAATPLRRTGAPAKPRRSIAVGQATSPSPLSSAPTSASISSPSSAVRRRGISSPAPPHHLPVRFHAQ